MSIDRGRSGSFCERRHTGDNVGSGGGNWWDPRLLLSGPEEKDWYEEGREHLSAQGGKKSLYQGRRRRRSESKPQWRVQIQIFQASPWSDWTLSRSGASRNILSKQMMTWSTGGDCPEARDEVSHADEAPDIYRLGGGGGVTTRPWRKAEKYFFFSKPWCCPVSWELSKFRWELRRLIDASISPQGGCRSEKSHWNGLKSSSWKCTLVCLITQVEHLLENTAPGPWAQVEGLAPSLQKPLIGAAASSLFPILLLFPSIYPQIPYFHGY